jgi:predicted nuclease of predicted toxin-antitoxin system
VKLLFDENISHHLVESLSDCYPESTHVRNVGLERADDAEVWAYAAASRLTIVSKDSDFHQRSLLY